MDRTTLAPRIDHTVLGPETTASEARRICQEAVDYGMNACLPPCYLPDVRETFPDLTIATVVGFPHGQQAPAVKVEEAVAAWRAGADELDVVCNVGRLLSGDTESVTDELAEVVAAVPIPVKVIVQAPRLTPDQLRTACEAAVEADAAMVKTATGFADGGATVEDVRLMAEYLPVKASGGIGSYDDAMAMIEAGAERIGASSGVAIVDGAPSEA
ncbi:deoxyribose-phosphate aldolase [Halovivax ruber XH-70]|uniref:Deoxyribose-phosphate aldolase n=1 Tax=Halovivax ruber (strain DSM 18193 / JCM 13892 / XH-70) TaxID=797302 RepID=L0IB33_HALRX|nr:deoxyribose-phosphate aldolase [Halovivax ruber]AGB15441.1 deoxyribose-phosphate aldolase [Halovivax ruber XH-70]